MYDSRNGIATPAVVLANRRVVDWLIDLLSGNSAAHTMLVYSAIIATGCALGKIRLHGISLGATFVLFVGLAMGHFGVQLDPVLTDFMEDFGLIIFVFSIGLQVGPGFFSSFKKGGLRLNMLACVIVVLGIAAVLILNVIYGDRIGMPMLVGIMCGAIASTPALGAAEEALGQLQSGGVISEIPSISLGCAVAYPISIVGSIAVMMLIRLIFRINCKDEEQKLGLSQTTEETPDILTFRITQAAVNGMSLSALKQQFGHQCVATRVNRAGRIFIPHADTPLYVGDLVLIVTRHHDAIDLERLLGERVEYEWKDDERELVSRRIVVTKNDINGKTIGQLHFRSAYNVNVTRINRAGVNLLARPDLVLQVGDRVMVVGPLDGIEKVEVLLGNTLKRLNDPHLVTIFLGILLGIVLGATPIYLPHLPMPARLGLVGGPMVVAILLGRFGYKLRLITYTTQSANLMLRELGLCIFLASIGLQAGGDFVKSVVSPNGLHWLLCGCIITIVPALTGGVIARFMHLNFFTICGLIAGAHTNAPPLAYINAQGDTDEPAVAYSTVYPLVTFLRIVSAQVLILMCV